MSHVTTGNSFTESLATEYPSLSKPHRFQQRRLPPNIYENQELGTGH